MGGFTGFENWSDCKGEISISGIVWQLKKGWDWFILMGVKLKGDYQVRRIEWLLGVGTIRNDEGIA